MGDMANKLYEELTKNLTDTDLDNTVTLQLRDIHGIVGLIGALEDRINTLEVYVDDLNEHRMPTMKQRLALNTTTVADYATMIYREFMNK
jgi:hypothetical protein